MYADRPVWNFELVTRTDGVGTNFGVGVGEARLWMGFLGRCSQPLPTN